MCIRDRLCVLTLIVGLSILNIPVCAEEIPQDRQLPRLVDDADLLTDSEEQELNTELDEISEKQQCDVVVVTENSLDGKSAQDYACLLYTSGLPEKKYISRLPIHVLLKKHRNGKQR